MEASGMLFLFSRPKEDVRVPLRRAKVVLWAPQAAALRQRHASAGGVQGGCRHRMGYLPFGFGGRICMGRSQTGMEYRVVVAMVLRRFKLAVATEYWHAPRVMLSLRPSDGVQLLLTPLQQQNK